jgi:predicted permease
VLHIRTMMIRELRLALRALTKSPGFLALAVLTLALGIGTATVLFSVTESVLWRPLPFADSERLVRVFEQNLKRTSAGGPVSALNFSDWRDRVRTLDGLAAMSSGQSHNLTGRGIGERVSTKSVSAGFFETLRVQPALGRTFRREDERAGTNGLVILSHDFWQRAFDGSPAVVGQHLKLDGERCTVIGVMSTGFRLEFAGDPDVFLPLPVTGSGLRRDSRELMVLGRTRPGISLSQATGEIQRVAGGLAAEYPQANANWGASVENLRESFTRYHRLNLFLYLGFSGLVLLIACANVASLLLVRFVGRQKEFALRTALGASRASLLRQTLAETAWIAIPGGTVGAMLAAWGVEGMRAILPEGEFSRSGQISMDLRALAFVLAVSLACAFVFALAPAVTGTRLNLDGALRDWGRSLAGNPRASRRIDVLIGAEVTLAFLLMFGAGLFLGTHARLHQVRLGFDPRGVLTMQIAPGSEARSNPQKLLGLHREILHKTESLAGIQRAALASSLPLLSAHSVNFALADGPRPAHGEEPWSLVRAVSPEYFRVMGIPLLRGRGFTEQDSPSAPRVGIINENLARRMFGAENPVGKDLAILAGGDTSIPLGPMRIIGLASNTKEAGLDEVVFNDIYCPMAQNPARSMYLVAKTPGLPEPVIRSLRHDLQSLDPEDAVYNLATMEDRIRDSLTGERFNLTLVSVFAGLAVLLAGVGVYGAIGFAVAQRTREFGLRMALGARPRAILRLTLKRTVRLTLAGAGCGLGLALIVGTLVEKALYLVPGEHGGMLYGVGIHDPASLAGAAGSMLGLAALAGLVPAVRAARVDPLKALRHE